MSDSTRFATASPKASSYGRPVNCIRSWNRPEPDFDAWLAECCTAAGPELTSARCSAHGRIAPYGIANFRLTYRDPSDKWEVAARLTNAFAKYYFLTTQDQSYPVVNPASYDFASAIVGAPREWALTVKRRF